MRVHRVRDAEGPGPPQRSGALGNGVRYSSARSVTASRSSASSATEMAICWRA